MRRFTLDDGTGFGIRAMPLNGEATDRVLALVDKLGDGDAGNMRELFNALLDAACEDAAAVRPRATYADVKLAPGMLTAAFDDEEPAPEGESKNAEGPAASATGSGPES